MDEADYFQTQQLNSSCGHYLAGFLTRQPTKIVDEGQLFLNLQRLNKPPREKKSASIKPTSNVAASLILESDELPEPVQSSPPLISTKRFLCTHGNCSLDAIYCESQLKIVRAKVFQMMMRKCFMILI